MEVKLDKRYAVPASAERAWSVLSDVRATAACMPGASITEQVDATHFHGSVKSRVGPAVMSFNGEIEVLALDVAKRSVQLLGKGADKSGSSASMNLSAAIESGETPDSSVLVGQATIVVSGKLAQFGSRLLVPVSDAMLKQFADNFGKAAAAESVAAAGVEVSGADDEPAPRSTASPAVASTPTPSPSPPSSPAPPPALRPAPLPARQSVNELNALGLMWTVIKNWFAGVFGKR